LPIRLEAIKARIAAVQAAQDAVDAAIEAYPREVEMPVVIACANDWEGQRRLLAAEIVRYNDEIADYVILVTGPSAVAAPRLVPMLIGPPQTVRPAFLPGRQLAQGSPGEEGAVQQAQHLEPIAAAQPALPAAAPPNFATPAASQERSPIGFEPRYETRGGVPAPGTYLYRGQSGVADDVDPQPTLAPNRVKPEDSGSSGASMPGPVPHVARRMFADEPAASAPRPETPLFASLVRDTPDSRAQRMCEALHGNRAALSRLGTPIDLRTYLAAVGSDRRAAVEAYWLAAQRAAEYQAIALQAEWLKALEPVVLEQRNRAGAGAALRLETLVQATRADLLDAQAALVEAQFEITRRGNQLRGANWLIPSTAPHAGTYNTDFRASPEADRSLASLAAAVPAIHKTLVATATAMVEADTARATSCAAYASGAGSKAAPIDGALFALRRQTGESLAFLSAVTAYNQSIVQYTVAAWRSERTVDDLVQALVLPRATGLEPIPSKQ
jgi:hypothetical protein